LLLAMCISVCEFLYNALDKSDRRRSTATAEVLGRWAKEAGMKESTSCAAAVGCVPMSVLTGAAGGRRRRATRSMASHDADNPSRTNAQAEPDTSSLDRYGGPSATTVSDDRRRRPQEIEHFQV